MYVQDEYVEHSSCIVQCKCSHSGQSVASLDVDGVMKCVLLTLVSLNCFEYCQLFYSLQCPGTSVGWTTSGLLNAGCWYVSGDDLTGALHVL